MASIIGFPRIGRKRALKSALESFWRGDSSKEDLLNVAKSIRQHSYELQSKLDYICINDFSLYDHILDLIYMLGIIPERFKGLKDLDLYFAMCRGLNKGGGSDREARALEMTKWFNTNYHFSVPELSFNNMSNPNTFNITKIKEEISEAKSLGYPSSKLKVSLVGPLTLFYLSKVEVGESKDKDELFPNFLYKYEQFFKEIIKLDKELTIQLEEPIFVKGMVMDKTLVKESLSRIAALHSNIIFTTYFEHACEVVELLAPIFSAFALDFIHGFKNINVLEKIKDKKLYAGLIDGRNIWKSDLNDRLEFLKDIGKVIPKDNIYISSSCSLLHSPLSLELDSKMDEDKKKLLAFAAEKINEIIILEKAFKESNAFIPNGIVIKEATIKRIRQREEQSSVKVSFPSRSMKREERLKIQKENFNLGTLPTTTIGSFPQDKELRRTRAKYKKKEISKEEYETYINTYIKECIKLQEEIGLDVLVHGEPERNDMVEFFASMEGLLVTQEGWVQSYGSRCVKPPIIFGDVARTEPLTLREIVYAQQQTNKIVKGMLTGPITIINWSFVREDISKLEIVKQLGNALGEEIKDLEKAGIKIIQMDEAAFKEGYPLRDEKRRDYEDIAILGFRQASKDVSPKVALHSHMCYSNFSDCIDAIALLDADVLSIECSRSGGKLIEAFKDSKYNGELGLGVYDIHSPRIPPVEEMKEHIQELLKVLPIDKTWINPDCGLKTRTHKEVLLSLKNMIEARNEVLKELTK